MTLYNISYLCILYDIYCGCDFSVLSSICWIPIPLIGNFSLGERDGLANYTDFVFSGQTQMSDLRHWFVAFIQTIETHLYDPSYG